VWNTKGLFSMRHVVSVEDANSFVTWGNAPGI